MRQGVEILPVFYRLKYLNMKKLKIAVIDTALNIESLPKKIQNKVELKNYFNCNNTALHSSMVINTLLKYTDANLIEKIYLYNIFGKDNKGSGIAVISALESIIIKNDIDFLIMSMTLTNKDRYKYIEKLCNKITSLGITIIAADSNKFTENKCYPFSFDCVYGVSQGMFSENPFFYTVDIKKKHIIGDATPEFVYCGNNTYFLFGGTSKAVPKFLAAIINDFSKEEEINCEKIEEWVKNNSLSAEDNTILCLKENYSVPSYSTEIYDTLCRYIDECSIDIRKYGEISPSFHLEKLESHDLVVFIVYIMERFNIKSSLDDIRYTDFVNLGSLCAYIGGQL